MVFNPRPDASDPDAPQAAPADLPPRIQVAGWQVDTVGGVLHRDGRESRLTARAASVLRVLLANVGNTVTREQLIRQVWPDSYPTDDVVTKAIREIRGVLGEGSAGGRMVDTIPRVGYRLNAEISIPAATPIPPAPVADDDDRDAAAAAATTPGLAPTAASPAVGGRRRGTTWAYAAFALLALAALLAWGPSPWHATRPPTDDAAPRSATALLLQQGMISGLRPLTALPGTEILGTLAPDGSAVAYMASPSLGEPFRIYVAAVDALQPRRLSSLDDPATIESSPEWSPDGSRIAFQRITPQGCGIYLAALAGSAERRLIDCDGVFAQFLEFSPDGSELGVFRAPQDWPQQPARLQMLSLATGALRPFDYEIADEPWESDVEARFSPDGRWIAIRRGRPPYGRIYILPGTGGKATEYAIGRTRALAGFDWLPDSRALLVATGYSAPSELRLVFPQDLARELVGTTRLSWPRFAARSGRAVFTQSDEHGVIYRFGLDDAADGAEPRRLFESTYSEQAPARAPTSGQLAFVSTRSGTPQVHVGDPRTGTDRQLTRFSEGTVAWPRWSVDESEIVFVHQGSDNPATVHVLRVADLHDEVVATGFERVRQAELAADGRSFYVDALTGDGVALWRIARHGGARQRIGEGVLLGPRRVPDSTDLLAVDPVAGTLVRLDADGARRGVVAREVLHWNRYAWDVTAQGVYLVGGRTLQDFGLYFQPWEGEPTRLRALPRILPAYGVAVDAAGSALYLGAAHLASSDLVLMQLDLPPSG